jgi:5-methyltetrahydropteroyltriglutamate--homocysteine methyltransferase
MIALSGDLLHSFLYPISLATSRFSAEDLRRIDVPHSEDVDHAELLPSVLELKAGNYYNGLAGERGHVGVRKIISQHLKADQMRFVGVVVPINPRVVTPKVVRDRVLEAAQFIHLGQLGTADGWVFSPFCNNSSTSRDTALEKIRARLLGTALSSGGLGGG